jgi:uncharacterized membrane protein
MIEKCPVCGGKLYVEEERARRFGRARRAIRCDSCRSILRQRDNNRWHYAVDPAANAAFHAQYNGQTFTEDALEALLEPPGAPSEAVDVVEDTVPSEPDEAGDASPPAEPEPEPAQPDDEGVNSPAAEEDTAAPRFIAGDDWAEDFLSDEDQ